MKEQLQQEFDQFLNTLESNGYKIHGRKIVQVRPSNPLGKLVVSINIIKNGPYVGDGSWLKRSITGDIKLSSHLMSLIEEHKPNQIKFTEEDVLFDNVFVMDRGDFYIDDLEDDFDENQILTFIKNNSEELEYQLFTEEFNIGDDEYDLYEVDCSIHYKKRASRIKYEEWTE